MADLNVIEKQNSMVLEDHAHSKWIHDEIDDKYTSDVQGFRFDSYDDYDCYNIDEYAIYQNHLYATIIDDEVTAGTCSDQYGSDKDCAFDENGFWYGSGFNEYIYDDLNVVDYTNGECQSETKESTGDDCTADGTVDCAVESYATGTDKMV